MALGRRLSTAVTNETAGERFRGLAASRLLANPSGTLLLVHRPTAAAGPGRMPTENTRVARFTLDGGEAFVVRVLDAE